MAIRLVKKRNGDTYGYHDLLLNRDNSNQHVIKSITGLKEILDNVVYKIKLELLEDEQDVIEIDVPEYTSFKMYVNQVMQIVDKDYTASHNNGVLTINWVSEDFTLEIDDDIYIELKVII